MMHLLLYVNVSCSAQTAFKHDHCMLTATHQDVIGLSGLLNRIIRRTQQDHQAYSCMLTSMMLHKHLNRPATVYTSKQPACTAFALVCGLR